MPIILHTIETNIFNLLGKNISEEMKLIQNNKNKLIVLIVLFLIKIYTSWPTILKVKIKLIINIIVLYSP